MLGIITDFSVGSEVSNATSATASSSKSPGFLGVFFCAGATVAELVDLVAGAGAGAGTLAGVGVGGIFAGTSGASIGFIMIGGSGIFIAGFTGATILGSSGIFTPFTKPAKPSTRLLVCSKSRVLLFINERTGKSYGLFPNGCSICSAAASMPNNAKDKIVVTGTTPQTPTSCTKIIGNEHTYTMSVDFKCVMMHPGGG